MNPGQPTAIAALSVAEARRIDAVCGRMEESLSTGQACRLEDCLSEVDDSLQPAMLRQLLLLEWEYLSRRGEGIVLTDYLNRFPQHAAMIRAVGEEHAAVLESPPGNAAAPVLRSTSPSRAAIDEWKRLGYEIMGRLGRGGMGTVYLACQTSCDQLVAVKVLRHDLDHDERDFDRFQNEVQTLARLNHPNIVPVFEVGQIQGQPFYSREYYSAGSLADSLRKQRPTPDQAAKLVETLSRAVDTAHQSQIIHRDLKPSNVLLHKRETNEENGMVADGGQQTFEPTSEDLIPSLADFGLALSQDGTAETQSGVLLGTPQ